MKEAAGRPQAPGRTPHNAPQGPLRWPGAEDTPPEASEAPAREASVASAPGYTARRTLPLRVEAIRQLRRAV